MVVYSGTSGPDVLRETSYRGDTLIGGLGDDTYYYNAGYYWVHSISGPGYFIPGYDVAYRTNIVEKPNEGNDTAYLSIGINNIDISSDDFPNIETIWLESVFFKPETITLTVRLDSNDTVVHGSRVGEIYYNTGGVDFIDGSLGTDTAVFSNKLADYAITRTSTGHVVKDKAGSETVETLINIERLKFADKSLAFDIDGAPGQVYRLYQAAFNRVPDISGLGNWISSIDHGTSLENVATGFVESAEFKALFGTPSGGRLSSSNFVTQLYDNVLHRDPDAAGYNYWLGELAKGVSAATILTRFSESTENKLTLMAFDMHGYLGQGYRLYQAAFDRKPDVSGLDYWVNKMFGGTTLEGVASGFMNSAEFAQLYGSSPSAADFVERLYRNVLDRAQDTDGYGYWTSALSSGATREQVLIGFSESLENQLALIGIVQDGIVFM